MHSGVKLNFRLLHVVQELWNLSLLPLISRDKAITNVIYHHVGHWPGVRVLLNLLSIVFHVVIIFTILSLNLFQNLQALTEKIFRIT
jgi:hypothetical protein